MARTKAFIEDDALDAAIEVYREHGFEGTSTEMLVSRLKVGRQSLYDTFGDKWKLYLSAVSRYVDIETGKHLTALRTGSTALDGIRAMVDRVVDEASTACLGTNAVCEFGNREPDLVMLRQKASRLISSAIANRIRQAQAEQQVSPEIDANDAASFLIANFAGIRIAARAGASRRSLQKLGKMALRVLR
ncbi:TetR/AcrR family transcriptional regulator [Paraburkholderia strydomiana]|uniref:TetR/AcrR family transcriptional regulator n=1 Tax=Paraburkholderia strydomiana TaxID=1245417 RepID=UPI002857DAF0|nr:TetR/AcrR family transcriptional regulator [Paraburkholderia strydomiana]MDR7009290.1 AcrR family transcriptional regulator [Paraburkholderia strydomiana]